ncbi:MAG: LCP family protein [Actinomycetes bacterium]
MAATRPGGPPSALPPHLDPRGHRGGTTTRERPSGVAGGGPTGHTGRSAGPARRPRRRGRLLLRWTRRLVLVVAAATAVVVLVVSATGWSVLQWSGKKIARVDAFAGLTNRPPESANGSTNFLLVGSDGRAGMSAADMKRLHVGNAATAGGRRADTMLLMHVSPQHATVTVVSLPRDSYVTIPEHVSATDGTRVREHRNKLNSAYAWGGAPLTVAAVEATTGLRIDHYIELDFLGFVRLVDAIGGVDVCAPTRLRDRKAGLRLPKGVTHVDGRTGLAYVRARHLDARADLGRIERQQRFLGAMASRVTSRDVLLDPRAMIRFLNAALDAVRADPGLTEKALVALGTQLRHASSKDVRFRTVPIANPSYRAGSAGAVALWDETAAHTMFAAMRDDTAVARKKKGSTAANSGLTVPPDQVRVQVFNGSGVVGVGGKASTELSGRGFAIAGPAQNWSTRTVQRTMIRYDARYTESIRTLAAAMPGARLVPVVGLGRTLQVVTGTAYDGARAVHVSPAGASAPNALEGRTAAADPCS